LSGVSPRGQWRRRGKKAPQRGFLSLIFFTLLWPRKKAIAADCRLSEINAFILVGNKSKQFALCYCFSRCYLLFLICCLLPPLQPSLSQIGLTYCCLCLNFCLHPKTVGIIKLVSVWGSTQVGINNKFF